MYPGKKFLTGAIALLLASNLFSGCGSGDGKGDAIAYLNYNDKDAFVTVIKDAFTEGANSQGLQVEFYDAKGDSNMQLDQFKEAVAKGAKEIVLLAVDGDSIVPAIDEAVASGVTILSLNRDVPSDKVLAVASDNTEAGKLQGEYMAAHLPQGAKIVYLEGSSDQASAVNRWEGFKAACLDKRADIQLLAMQDADYNKAEAMKTMALWLTLFPQIDAVICGNDQMALGAVSALKAAGRLAGCQVSGVDATEEALAAVAAGEMVQTVKQDAVGQANGAVTLLSAIKKGDKPSQGLVIPFTSITRDNLSQNKK